MVMKSLALFFTFNMSVKTWFESGLLAREKLIYDEHIKQGNLDKVFWFTYGCDDRQYSRLMNKMIEIVPMPKIFNFKIGKIIYSFILPFLFFKIFKEIGVLKTNQMPGSFSAVLCKMIYRKPLILRTGWTWSAFIKEHLNIRRFFLYLISVLTERIGYTFCDCATVSSKFQKKYLIKKYNIPSNKVYVLPNYIDTHIFNKKTKVNKRRDAFLFIGRLEKQKNLFNLIEAIARMNKKLVIYGNGSLKDSLKKHAKRLGASVIFNNRISNNNLSGIYNKYKYFILPSLFEGMPKTLLEAMACGCLCIGTPVKGIQEVLQHEHNGWITKGTDDKSIFNIINHISKLKSSMMEKYSIRAVQLIRKEYSIEKYLNIEKGLLNKII